MTNKKETGAAKELREFALVFGVFFGLFFLKSFRFGLGLFHLFFGFLVRSSH